MQPQRSAVQPRRSLASGARACLVVGAAFTALRWSAGWPATSWRAVIGGSGTGEAGFDRLLVNSAALAAWVGLGWFCLVAALALASRVPGASGRLCGAISRRLTPRLLRRLVEAAIGISIVAGPLAGGSAFANPVASTPAASTPAASTPAASTPAAPTPVASAPATSAPAASATPAASEDPVASANSIWLDRPTSHVTSAPTDQAPIQLDRPAATFVASAPRPMVVRTPAGPATLIAGSPHRDVGDRSADDSYVVRRGDALWDIAARHLGPSATAVDIAREWPRWYQANRAVIGDDPSLIRPGELLVPPR
jgi:hypothetical protein